MLLLVVLPVSMQGNESSNKYYFHATFKFAALIYRPMTVHHTNKFSWDRDFTKHAPPIYGYQRSKVIAVKNVVFYNRLTIGFFLEVHCNCTRRCRIWKM